MTPNEQSFIDAAITKACATRCYNCTARAALKDMINRKAATKARQNAARVMNSANIEFDKAYKRVTDPFLCPK